MSRLDRMSQLKKEIWVSFCRSPAPNKSLFPQPGKKKKSKWFRPGSNWRPSACKADVMTTTLRNHTVHDNLYFNYKNFKNALVTIMLVPSSFTVLLSLNVNIEVAFFFGLQTSFMLNLVNSTILYGKWPISNNLVTSIHFKSLSLGTDSPLPVRKIRGFFLRGA